MSDQRNILPPPPTGWPAPLADAALLGLAGEIVRTIDPHTEADPAALLLQLLAAFGNVVGRGSHFKVEADRHGTNLFVALVGQTSKARKGSSWGHIGQLMEVVDSGWVTNRIERGLSSGEGLVRAVWDGTQSDPGLDDKRLFVFDSEFGGTLKVMSRHGNSLSSIIRQAWDGATLQVMTRRFPLKAIGAHISIVAHTTQQDLVQNLGFADRFNGFANRYLWTCVRRSKFLPQGGAVPKSEMQDLTQRLMGAADFARQARRLEFSEKASQMWGSEYRVLTDDRPGLFGAVTSRAEAQVVRLATIYALLQSSEAIKIPHLKAALAVWDYCLASAKFIFEGKSAGKLDDKLLSVLKSSESGMTRTEVSSALHRHASSDRIEQALTSLSQKGEVKCRTEKTQGRPVTRWIYVGNRKD